jgi:SAM-dependent methyltransferase
MTNLLASKILDVACSCCGFHRFIEVVKFSDIPASGLLRISAEIPLTVRELGFEACINCGFLRNRNFASPPDYSERPRPTARQLPTYQDQLLDLIKKAAVKEDSVLEVGSNDGTFLDLLSKQGYTNTYGVEPSCDLVKLAREKGHRIVAEYFGPDIIDALLKDFGAPKLIICRHTLEHVPNPAVFVRSLRTLLVAGKGVALVEVPDSSAIPEGVNFVEFWDEHLFYFTPFTLKLLMKRHGLKVVSEVVLPHLETRNILLQVTSDACHDGLEENAVILSEISVWKKFSDRFRIVSEQIRNEVLAAQKPIYMIGASHPQCNFVNYLELASLVDFMIDDDPLKVGKLPSVSSTSLMIINSEEFSRQAQFGTLLLTGFGYECWTRKLCDLAGSKSLQIIDPRKISLYDN